MALDTFPGVPSRLRASGGPFAPSAGQALDGQTTVASKGCRSTAAVQVQVVTIFVVVTIIVLVTVTIIGRVHGQRRGFLVLPEMLPFPGCNPCVALVSHGCDTLFSGGK